MSEPRGPIPRDATLVGCVRPRVPTSGTVQRCRDVFANNIGLLLIALSQAFTSLMGVFVKFLNAREPRIPPVELIWIRMVMTWAVCVAYMRAIQVPHPILGPEEIRHLLALRGLAGFVGLFGTYYALQYLSLSDTTVLSFLTPMCTAVTGALFLKEEITLKQSLASAASFVGVLLIARPEFLFARSLDPVQPVVGQQEASSVRAVASSQRLGAVGVAMLGVVGLTTAYTTIRAIGKRAHPMHNLAAFALVCIITGPVALFLTGTSVVVPRDAASIVLLLAVSSCGFFAQVTMTTGLQLETAGRGTMAIYVQVIFSIILEYLFFHAVPSSLSMLGTVIIIASAIYVVLSKKASSQKTATSAEEQSLEEGLLANNDEVAQGESVELDKFSQDET
ncbi:EamA-like transporter family-domain-containing protein [Trametes polyzona]|nr:EamA-like transporter family-domain-containing protein [Trametes polyzona]